MAIRFSGREQVSRGADPLRRAEPRPDPKEPIPAENILRPASPPARFSGYCWNLGLVFIFLGAFLGLLFTTYVMGSILPRRELIAPLFEVLGFEVNWFSLPAIIGGSLGLLTFLFWAGRTRITVNDRGIEVEGAIRHALIPWDEIEKVSIGLNSSTRGPPTAIVTIRRKSVPYKALVDLPRGTRRRLCDAIEAHGVETSNSFLAGTSPLFGFLMFGLPTIIFIAGL